MKDGFQPNFRLIYKNPSPALLVIIALLIGCVIRQVAAAASWGHDSFQMTEWLINYSGGFVRRGLPGTLIGLLSGVTGIQANHFAIITGLGSYLLLTAWLLRRATVTFPAVLILSCIVMGFPAYQDSIVRKDCMGLLFLIACLVTDHSRFPRPVVIAILNLVSGVAILCHEAFVFYAVAGFILLGSIDRSTTTPKIIRRFLSLLPAGLCFLISVIRHGSPEQAQTINDSWQPLWKTINPGDLDIAIPDAAIGALGWTSEQGLSLSLYMLTSGFYQPLAWVMVFVISFILVLIFTGRNFDQRGRAAMESRVRVSALLLAQFIFISPLFLLGVDYGRWLFFWVAGSMIFHTMGRRAPAWMESLVEQTFEAARVPAMLSRVPARDWYLLFFGVPICWNLHNFLCASPVMRHLEMIRSWF
jgi:hypothetical protein